MLWFLDNKPYAAVALVTSTFLAALGAAWFVHGVVAVLLTSFIASASVVLLGLVLFDLSGIVLLMWSVIGEMIIAGTIGAIGGILTRRWISSGS